jgi:hypothetical protein
MAKNHRYMDPIDQRFRKFFTKGKPNECWIWNGSKNGEKTYGLFIHNGKRYLAHRLALKLSLGRNLKKPMALHTCNNPICVNPNHLYEGTAKDNIDDCVRAGRWNGFGSKHRQKLTWEIAKWIRANYQKRVPGRSITDIAKKFGVYTNAVQNIIHNKAWKI